MKAGGLKYSLFNPKAPCSCMVRALKGSAYHTFGTYVYTAKLHGLGKDEAHALHLMSSAKNTKSTA